VVVATLVMSAAASAAAHITGVTWGGGSSAPTATIAGTGFGKTPPKGASAGGAPGCAGATGNDYGTALFFIDDTQSWQAGAGKPPTSGACVGVVVNSWTNTSVSVSFGNEYGSFNWTVFSGDNFVWAVKGYYWGGVVSFPGVK
jgi:hypothetical protein